MLNFDENKKISTPKRRETKCRKRYFYVLKRRWPSNLRLLKSGNEFGVAGELSKSQGCDGKFLKIESYVSSWIAFIS